MNKLKLIVLKSSQELGIKVNQHLTELNATKKSYCVPITEDRFSNGEGKVRIDESVNGTDLFILSDVGNYGVSYKMHGRDHYMAPDEHFEDIKRAIAAASGHAKTINIIMPLLYESRQHKRKGNESLDCAISLQELEHMGVNSIITFDAHDPSICNAIPTLPFDNFYPTHNILETLIATEDISDILVVSPDMGAMERARYYADMLSCDVGVFYKRRDLSKVVNGKNPIVEHLYMGADPKDKDILVVDDMIASGSSMLEVAELLKSRGARHVYLVSTFSLFTEGIESFIKGYQEGIFDKLYSTNLSYIPESLRKEEWFIDVDCSKYLAEIINTIHKQEELDELWNGKKKLINKIKRVMNK